MKPIPIQSENPAGSPQVEPTQTSKDEFKRFAGLTDKLVKVPKNELDERRRKAT